ncbi:Transmembrane protein [Heracleum sosnowskyi]|uniref:Transmembrane protein n=1 Tax=Heracleum sosnowskyi TaxID=360622 RepID=A0AAD8JIB7_9APIA|nr:Transmembrane protein [Heracleum sosnowskyi]
MAQYRQSGFDRVSARNGGFDQVSVGIRGGNQPHKQSRLHNRRFRGRKISIGALALTLVLAFVISVLAFVYFSADKGGINDYTVPDDGLVNDTDFLTNVTRTDRLKVLKFGQGSVAHGRDSRYWDKDDRRRDDDYNEEAVEHSSVGAQDRSTGNVRKGMNSDKKPSFAELHKVTDHKGIGLYNEAGRNELKMYEAEYEASLKNVMGLKTEGKNTNQLSDDAANGIHTEEVDADDEYDDDLRGSSSGVDSESKRQMIEKDVEESSSEISEEDSSLSSIHSDKLKVSSRHVSVVGSQYSKKSSSEKRSASKKKTKRHKFSGSCEMKISNSTSQLIEPLESRKFSRFALQYRETEENISGEMSWEPRFAGHQSLEEREESYIAHDQKINCGFVRGPKGSPSTGFDLGEDDSKYLSSCHIAVSSCIFGNSDRLRVPTGRTVSTLSRKNVCFVMFMDEITLRTLSSEGHRPDTMGFIGLWKIVMVKNLPYSDMRRVGKIPKFLSHRLFPSARYSIWLDSKLRLQLDPMLILEYFLWRKGHEYAISNHYDRHCLWEEVAQNKKLNKFNHTIIDEQFAFYQADGLKRFNASDPDKLLPSNVPEGSFILSFAYTYQKLRRTNPSKPFDLNMFKDCERRRIAKLFRHRSEESKYIAGHATE